MDRQALGGSLIVANQEQYAEKEQLGHAGSNLTAMLVAPWREAAASPSPLASGQGSTLAGTEPRSGLQRSG